jgi:tetratricopeptide (TPR) repeat protein
LSEQRGHVTFSGYPFARVFDVATSRAAGPMLSPGGQVIRIQLAPDDRTAVLVTTALPAWPRLWYGEIMLSESPGISALQFWDWRNGKRLREPIPLPTKPHDLAYSPDGQRVVVICRDGEILIVDSAEGRILRRLEHPREGVDAVADNFWATTHSGWFRAEIRFTPDGSSFITSGLNGSVRVWDTETGEPRYGPLRHHDICTLADISTDGRWFLTTSRDDTARVWDSRTGAPAGPPLQHPEWVFGACFHPNGDLVLTTCHDGIARLWDWHEGRIVGVPLNQLNRRASLTASSVAFCRNGDWALTSSDGVIRAWDWRTGAPVMPPYSIGAGGNEMLVASDGTHVVAAGYGSGMSVLDVAEFDVSSELDADDLCLQAELLSGFRIQQNAPVLLTTEEWLERWQTFRVHCPDELPLDVVDRSRWEHHMQADLAVMLRTRGRTGVEQGHYDEAIPELRESLMLNPDDQLTLRSLADALNTSAWRIVTDTSTTPQDADRAVALAEEAIKLIPAGSFWITHVIAGYRLGRWDTAINSLEKAEALDPQAHLGRTGFFLAMAHGQLGHEHEARDWYDRSVEWMEKYRSGDAELTLFRAEADEQQGRWDEVFQDYTRLIERHPDQLTRVLQRIQPTGQPDDEPRIRRSVTWFDEQIEKSAGAARLLEGRALAHAALKQPERALADYAKAIELDPQSAVAHNNLAWLLATCPDVAFRDPDRAVQLAMKAVELAPTSGTCWNTVGVAHYRAQNWKAAIEALIKSDELMKGNDLSFNGFFLAIAHWQLNQKEEARAWFEKSVSWMDANAPDNEELQRFRAEAAELLEIPPNTDAPLSALLPETAL